MTARLATVLIFLFCGTMTTLLVRSVLYPEESRLADVTPHVPFDLFVARTEGSNLDIWEGSRIIGKCHIVPSSGVIDPLVRQDRVKVRLDLLLQLRQKIMDADVIDVTGEAVLHADGTVDDYELKIELARSVPLIRLVINQPEDQKFPSLKLSRGNAILFESPAGKPGDGIDNPIASGMLLGLGIPPEALSGNKEQSAVPSTVRAGNIEAGGQTFDGYLLTTGADEETKFRLYMSNTGGILHIKTPMGVEMLAEALRPAGAKAPELKRY